MKIPNKIRLLGYTWKVIIDKNSGGGSFAWNDKIIKIGDKYGEKEAIFLHEIMEAILTDLGYRYYTNEENSPYLFNFNHGGFCLFHKELHKVLKDNKII